MSERETFLKGLEFSKSERRIGGRLSHASGLIDARSSATIVTCVVEWKSLLKNCNNNEDVFIIYSFCKYMKSGKFCTKVWNGKDPQLPDGYHCEMWRVEAIHTQSSSDHKFLMFSPSTIAAGTVGAAVSGLQSPCPGISRHRLIGKLCEITNVDIVSRCFLDRLSSRMVATEFNTWWIWCSKCNHTNQWCISTMYS